LIEIAEKPTSGIAFFKLKLLNFRMAVLLLFSDMGHVTRGKER